MLRQFQRALTNEVRQLHESRRSVTKSVERIGMLLDGEPYASLCAGDVQTLCHLSHTWVV